MSNTRIGTGYDIHPLEVGRKLVLGGIHIPFDKGLSGWSDADVLTHAIIDALLGAAALGDIGKHFPPGEPEYKDISSLKMLEKTLPLLKDNGWQIGNIDATVVAEQPKLSDYIDKIREQISRTLEIDTDQVSIKASTNNGLGYIGSGEGIAAYAVALILVSEGL
ncbi:2-C-methyl-D-erythritol 2,4-cyclodiphosphate synthase [Chloroflexota bacterium]